jgi:hypothetical protein
MNMVQQMKELGYLDGTVVMLLAQAEDLLSAERGDLADELAMVRHEVMGL